MKFCFYVLGAILSAFVLVFNPTTTKAQGNGKISGKVTDAKTKEPVDYATVSLFKAGSTSPLNGAITDSKGNFSLKNIADGTYAISIDFMGYQKSRVEAIRIVNGNSVTVPEIFLTSTENQLKDVTVTAKVPIVENKIDKLVYNAANDLTAQGGVALDVLKKVPMISVDIDGNVELQGDANIRFLINGKPSSIFGSSLTDALQSIPASQIKSIEVVTSPGAKYDANGTGGIINIILKDSKVQGINGTVNLSAGTRLENGSFNLNVRNGNFGVNAFLSGNKQLSSTTFTHNNRQTYNNTRDTLTSLIQDGSSAFTRNGYQSGLSFNWSASKKDELTATIGYNQFGNHAYGLTYQDQQQALTSGNIFSDIASNRTSDTRSSSHSVDWSLSYKKTFDKKDQELDVLVTSSAGVNQSSFFQQQDYVNANYPSSGSTASNPGKDRETDISVDYTQPFSKGLTVETGAKTVIENLNNTVITDTLLNNKTFVNNPHQTYGFNYSRKVFAYYLSANFSLFNWIDGKAGIRDEYTTTSADFPNTNIPAYNILAPSFTLSHKFTPAEALKFSYTYRIERPNYGDLNPFYNISDPHNISTGNPNLKPEIGHNFEVGYNRSFDGGGNIYIGATYRYNTDDLQSLTTFAQTLNIDGTNYSNVFLSQRFNIGRQIAEGFNIFGSLPIGNLSMRFNGQLGLRTNETPGLATVTGFAARTNYNVSYQFKHDLAAEVFINYNSPQKGIQGTRPGFFAYNMALRKQLWNKKASIGITAADPFNQFTDQKATTTGANFNQTSLRQVPFRTFGISLMYKFGKLEFKKEKESKDEPNNMTAPPENGGK